MTTGRKTPRMPMKVSQSQSGPCAKGLKGAGWGWVRAGAEAVVGGQGGVAGRRGEGEG